MKYNIFDGVSACSWWHLEKEVKERSKKDSQKEQQKAEAPLSTRGFGDVCS